MAEELPDLDDGRMSAGGTGNGGGPETSPTTSPPLAGRTRKTPAACAATSPSSKIPAAAVDHDHRGRPRAGPASAFFGMARSSAGSSSVRLDHIPPTATASDRGGAGAAPEYRRTGTSARLLK